MFEHFNNDIDSIITAIASQQMQMIEQFTYLSINKRYFKQP